MYACMLSHVRLFATPWTAAHQAPLSMKSSRQEYWRGWPFPSPGDLFDPGTEPTSLKSPALAGGFFTTSTTNMCNWTFLVSWKYPQITDQINLFGSAPESNRTKALKKLL